MVKRSKILKKLAISTFVMSTALSFSACQNQNMNAYGVFEPPYEEETSRDIDMNDSTIELDEIDELIEEIGEGENVICMYGPAPLEDVESFNSEENAVTIMYGVIESSQDESSTSEYPSPLPGPEPRVDDFKLEENKNIDLYGVFNDPEFIVEENNPVVLYGVFEDRKDTSRFFPEENSPILVYGVSEKSENLDIKNKK